MTGYRTCLDCPAPVKLSDRVRCHVCHRRVTRADHFLLVGGSAETHERMQDTAIRFDEALQKRGKALEEASAEEAIDLLRESLERS